METSSSKSPKNSVTRLWQHLSQRPLLLAAGVFGVALLVYSLTLAPGLLWGGGDFSTFQTKLYTGQIESNIFGHPLWVILARPFLWLPLRDVAYRANLASAVFAALALAFVFRSAWLITRSAAAALLASGVLLVSHTFWTYAVMPKPYSLNALLLASCIYLILRWGHDRRGRYLYLFAIIYGISPLNHLVMFTAALGFAVYGVLMARQSGKSSGLPRQLIVAAGLFLLSLLPFILLTTSGGQTQNTSGSIGAFVGGLLTALLSPDRLLLGLGAGLALLIYQFFVTIPIAIIGLRRSWRINRPLAWLLLLIAAGDIAFLLGATDPRTGGDYVWNLHYYLQFYVVFALWLAVGFDTLRSLFQTRLRQVATVGLSVGLPIFVYALAPIVARPFVANLPGFRDVGGRDNLTYVLSPWKQNETAPRTFADSILATLPENSVFFADYSIWSMINYLQIAEHARLDVTLVQMPTAGVHEQLPLLLTYRTKPNLYLADTGRYYDLSEIQTYFEVIPIGPIYQLIPK
jgi:hypothetical protein